MRIVLIGQAAFAEKVLERLLQGDDPVVGVFCPPDPPGGKPNPLKELARGANIPVFQPAKMRNPEVLETLLGLAPDLNVMAFVTDIVPESVLTCPRLGTIQYHPSLLPRHRGGSAINWAIIQGEEKTGLTIFWPDRGIDTGPILLQKEVPIGRDDTTGSLYFDKLFPLGVEAMVEAVAQVKAGTAPCIAQDESLATHEPLCKDALTEIDWSQPVEKVYNLIRGANPQPGAWTTWRGHKLKLYDSQKVPTLGDSAAGEIWQVEPDAFSVAAQGGSIRVKRVQQDREPKQRAADFIQQTALEPGERLGAAG